MAKAKQKTAVTVIPPQRDVVLFTVTEETIRKFEEYRYLVVEDIHDKKALAIVHDARMELVKARTTVDRVRKEMNEDAQEQITKNNDTAKSLLAKFAPIEKLLKDEEERVEAALEAERVAARMTLLDGRKRLLEAAVGDYGDILAAYPDDYLLSVGEAVFNPLLVTIRVQVEGRKQLAEQQRLAKEAADKAAAEKAEADRLAEVERLTQQAIEDAERKAAQAKLDSERAEFERQQADMARREKDERDRQQAILDAERKQLDQERAVIAADKQKQEDARLAAEREEKRLATVAELDRLAAEQAARIEAAKPDIEKLKVWVKSIETGAATIVPEMATPSGNDLLVVILDRLAELIEELEGMLE